jgi:hypothetical protein
MPTGDDPRGYIKDASTYTAGEDCKCHARSKSECGCDADWTDPRVYELQHENDALSRTIVVLRDVIEKYETRLSENLELKAAKRAIAALKPYSQLYFARNPEACELTPAWPEEVESTIKFFSKESKN